MSCRLQCHESESLDLGTNSILVLLETIKSSVLSFREKLSGLKSSIWRITCWVSSVLGQVLPLLPVARLAINIGATM